MKKPTVLMVIAVVVAMVATFGVSPGTADARISAGKITLSVKGTCTALGDSIREFYVWTPESGKQRVTSGRSATLRFNSINKKKRGDTYFNWKLTCRMKGTTYEHQKAYGGSFLKTNYSYTVERGMNYIKKP